jgi:hypothetical protein
MTPTRVLVLGLVLSSLVIGSAGLVASGGALDPGDTAQEGRGRPVRDNRTTQLFRLMGRDTLWTPIDRIKMTWPTFRRVEPMVTHPAPPQTRTCAINACGSSGKAFCYPYRSAVGVW